MAHELDQRQSQCVVVVHVAALRCSDSGRLVGPAAALNNPKEDPPFWTWFIENPRPLALWQERVTLRSQDDNRCRLLS